MNDIIRTPLPTILGSLQLAQNGSWSGHATPDWMQGRTLYGGISAALCLQAARKQFDGLPPLRSAQFSFVGPAAGDVTLTATMLRQGKSAAFVSVNLMSEAGHGTAAVICFGAPRQSTVSHNGLVLPEVARPEECDYFFPRGSGPQFSRHFEVRLASGSGPFTAASAADLILWVRPLDADTQPLEALWLALADMPPPAAMSMMSVPAPISTMSWMVDVLTPGHQSPDGWFLIQTTARHVADGYSEQTMLMWASDGVPLVSGHQSVALFS